MLKSTSWVLCAAFSLSILTSCGIGIVESQSEHSDKLTTKLSASASALPKASPSPSPSASPTPTPKPAPTVKPTPKPVIKNVVRGVYATGNSVGGSRFATLVKLIDQTELNSIVIDVKEDNGFLTFKSTSPSLSKLATMKNYISNPQEKINLLRSKQIYPIARIVVFKDTSLAKKHPEWSFRKADGSIWTNGRSESFVNPYVKQVWDYNVEVAKAAAKLGFQEIQFDYVRFPEGFEKLAPTLTFQQDERSRTEVVTAFVAYAKSQLAAYDIDVSVDIFGYAASVPAAAGIGQDFNLISANVDVICPMVYPSHYSTGWFGSKVPDAAPFQTINGAMKDTKAKLATLSTPQPIIRPWIQDFTASWIPGHIRYGKKEIEAQIKALHANGIYEFLLWNSGNTYTPSVNYDLK